MDTNNIYRQAVQGDHLPRSHSKQCRKYVMMGKNKYDAIDINKNENEVDCICNSSENLTKPAHFEETCYIFDMTENLFNVDSQTLLSLASCVSEIYYPFTNQYNFYRLNYNHRFNYYPVAIVRAHNIDDVINTIGFCRENGIPFRVRGGAHCYEPASIVNFGIVLDMTPMNTVFDVDHQNQTVTIQSGALLGPVIKILSEQNIIIPFGTCVTNGLAGLTLGGGIGFATRERGLTLDNVVNMEIVLADGEVVNANRKVNRDLFWAMRGAGGGNFGVVTNFTFNFLYADWVTVFTMNYNFDDTKEVFLTWQEWAPYTDTRLTAEMDIFNKYQPVVVTGQLLPCKNPQSDRKKMFKLLEPLIRLNLHNDFSIKTMTAMEAAEYFGQGSYARPLFFYNKSDFNFEPLPCSAIDVIIHHMSLLDKTQTYNKTEIDALGGNFSTVPSDATAFPSRKAIYWLQYTSLWDIQEQQKPSMEWLNNYYEDLRPYFPLDRKYVNALDYDSCPYGALKSYYGENLPRLVQVKRKYDPMNFFRFEQSIPLELDPNMSICQSDSPINQNDDSSVNQNDSSINPNELHTESDMPMNQSDMLMNQSDMPMNQAESDMY